MGRQQLLLLVLGVVLVGLAVVVGIQQFGEKQIQADHDTLVNRGVAFASRIHEMADRPAALGGMGGFVPVLDQSPTNPAPMVQNFDMATLGLRTNFTTEGGRQHHLVAREGMYTAFMSRDYFENPAYDDYIGYIRADGRHGYTFRIYVYASGYTSTFKEKKPSTYVPACASAEVDGGCL